MASSPEWPKGGLPMSWARQAAATMSPQSWSRLGRAAASAAFAFQQVAGGKAAQRAAHHGRFERVREARMHEVGFGQRHHLRLALQASEGRAEHYPVIVGHEGPAHGVRRQPLLVGEAAGAEQAKPKQMGGGRHGGAEVRNYCASVLSSRRKGLISRRFSTKRMLLLKSPKLPGRPSAYCVPATGK